MSKRAVLYGRVSYDDRDTDGRNLAGQLEMGREYSAKKGYWVVAELAEDDRGASGASFDLPKLNEALEMARVGEFDVLVVRELDRFARGLAKQLIVESEFKRAGVEVEYVLGEYPDTPEGNLMKNVRAVIAEYERLKISERMVRGRRQKVKAGSVMVHGRPPYGYQLVEYDGKQVLEICETEARIVRLIFAWYIEGDGENGPMSINDVTRKLSSMQVPTFSDTSTRTANGEKQREYGEWNRSSVSKILKNETYAGVWRYGKRGTNWTRNPEDYLIAVEVPVIIDRQTWEAAQARRAHNQQYARRNLKHKYLMSKRVTCGICGSKMAGKAVSASGARYLYYRCPVVNRDLDFVRTCDSPFYSASRVDAVVWDWVKSFLSDPVALMNMLDAHQAEQERANKPLYNRLAVVDELIKDNRGQLERLLDLYLIGDFPKDVLVERKNRLESTITALEKERVGLVAYLEAQMLTSDQIRTLQEFATHIAEGLEHADQDFDARQQIIDTLNVRITLTVEDGEKVVYAHCILDEDGDVLSVASTSTCFALCER